MGPHTRAVHAGEWPDPLTGAVAPPLYQASTYAYASAAEGAVRFDEQTSPPYRGAGYVYARWDNPTVRALELKLAALEEGARALAAATGMAAVSTALLTLLRGGDHVVAQRQLYSGTHHLFAERLPAWGIETTFVEGSDPASFSAALRPETKLVYVETPSNPRLGITDLEAVSQIARRGGAVTVCDNTFATPVNQRPLSLGIDLVVHSMTKFLCGHGDAMGGAIVGSEALLARCVPALRDLGGSLSPFNAWLITRALHTLPLRVERHNANALALAAYLSGHERIECTHYPGLATHPGHETARRQMPGGFGGVLSFEVRGGLGAGRAVVDALELATQAVSLGDTRTLVCHPASTTHRSIPPAARASQGIGAGLIRVSVGLEDVEDLIADFAQALEARP